MGDPNLKNLEHANEPHKRSVFRGVRVEPSTAWSWAALIAAALVAFWLTRGTSYHRLALGVLLSSVTLLILLSVFELLWQALAVIFDSDTTDGRG